MNVCPRAEQSTAFQVFNTSGNNDLPSGTSSPPYPPYNNVHATSLLRPEQFLPTPDHISSFMSTEFPLIQHNTLSTTCPEKFQSNIFQHNTRDFQCANFVSLCLGYVSSEWFERWIQSRGISIGWNMELQKGTELDWPLVIHQGSRPDSQRCHSFDFLHQLSAWNSECLIYSHNLRDSLR